MKLRQAHPIEVAAAKADISRATGYRIAQIRGFHRKRRNLSCCRFRGHEDKIVTKEPESGYDETEVQP